MNGKLKNVKSLIKNGANINYVTENSLNALMWTANKTSNINVVKTLLLYNANIDHINQDGHVNVINSGKILYLITLLTKLFFKLLFAFYKKISYNS